MTRIGESVSILRTPLLYTDLFLAIPWLGGRYLLGACARQLAKANNNMLPNQAYSTKTGQSAIARKCLALF